MKHPMLLAAGLALALAAFAPAEAGEVLLAEDGEPRAVILVPAGAGRRSIEQQSAELLQDFIQRMSGAELAIVSPGEGAMWRQVELAHEGMNFVLVGAEDLARQLGIEAEGLGPGGFRMKTFANGVALLGGPSSVEGVVGADGGGVRHAAIELLERQGVRYLWPGELGLVVPHRPAVAVEAADFSYTPQILQRRLRWGGLGARGRTGLERLGIAEEQWHEGRRRAAAGVETVSWLAWQRMGGRMPTFGHAGAGLNHAIRRSGKDAEQYMREHPEWFALQGDGTRDQGGDSRWRLCKSNPELIEHVANGIIQRRNEEPGLGLVSLCPNDGGGNTGWCMCDGCVALDPPEGPAVPLTSYGDPVRPGSRRRQRNRIEHVSLTDRMLYYWNSVAERVAEVHPDMRFGVSAYGIFSRPPVQRTLHPNLVVRYVPSTAADLEGWIEAGMSQVFWRPNILGAYGIRRDGKLRSIVGNLADNMRDFARAGLRQTDFDSVGQHWAALGLSYYAAARLNWNPTTPAAEIVEDYARHGFGGGGEHIVRYFERIEELTGQGVTRAFRSAEDRAYTPDAMAELRGLLNAAEAAADDETVSERVAFLRMGLNFTDLQETLDEKALRAREGMDVDMERARRLVDLNCLVLRALLLHHHFASNVANLVTMSGTFARFSAIGGRTVTPSSPALLERVDDPAYGWTGREDSMEEMLAAFGLD